VSEPARHFFTRLCVPDRRQRLGYTETRERCAVCADPYLAAVDVAALYRGPGPLGPLSLADVAPDPRARALGAWLNSNEALNSGVPGSPRPHDGSPQNGSPPAPSSPSTGTGATAGAPGAAGAAGAGAEDATSLPHAWLANDEVFSDPDFPAFTIW